MIAVGDIVVLRGLRESHGSSAFRPPAVARIEKIDGARVVVKLRQGHLRWAPKPRIVYLSNVIRPATAREIEMGWPCEEKKAVAS